MTGNRSLDEFAGTPDEGDDRPAAVDGSATTDADDAAGPAADDEAESAVEPVASTYAWSPDGGECAVCGATAEERWRDGDDLVCLDCKEW